MVDAGLDEPSIGAAGHGAIEIGAVIELAVDIVEEVGGGDRRSRLVDLDEDPALARLDKDPCGHGLSRERSGEADEQGKEHESISHDRFFAVENTRCNVLDDARCEVDRIGGV